MSRVSLRTPQSVTVGVLALCFLLVGIPFWLLPYSSVTVPNAFFGFGVVVVFSAASFLGFRLGFVRPWLLAGMIFPAVLMARVVVEGLIDPTRHNLWPLALILAAIFGLVVAGPGALLGSLAAGRQPGKP